MNHLPSIGIAPPSTSRITVRVRPNGDVAYRKPRRLLSGRRQYVPFYTLSNPKFLDLHAQTDTWWSGQTLVPVVPPEVREKHAAALRSRDSLIFFEAEWTKCTVHEPPLPRDPALLQRVSGDLWAVLAVWELTAVEIAALS